MATLCSLNLYERGGYSRTGDYVTVSVPLAESDAITAVSSLALTESGVSIPATFTPVSRWWGLVTDGTKNLKVVQVTFRCTLSANVIDTTTYAVTNGGVGSSTSGIQVTETVNYYDITTGTVDGSGHFRIRKVAAGGHNLFDVAEVRASSAWKAICATGNDSALYLKGVATATDPPYIAGGTAGTLTGNALASKTIVCTVNGSTTTFTFAATAPTTMIGITAAIAVAYNNGVGTIGWSARNQTDSYDKIELVAPAGATATLNSGTALVLLGLTAGSFASSADGQNADYKSNAYTGGSYSTPGIELPTGYLTNTAGGEKLTLQVNGQFGSTAFVGFHDEINLGKNNGNGTSVRNRAALSYEARYTFYANSAYVGMDVMWKGAGGTQSNQDCGDAAVKNGGIRFVPNFSGANTNLYTTCYDTTGSVYRDSTLAYASGTPRVYQSYAPSGTAYNFALESSGFTFAGTPNQLNEGWFGVGDSAADRYMVLMQEDTPREKLPHGFRYDGTNAEINLWPSETGDIHADWSGKTYHIFCGQWYYRWRGGILFGSGALSASICRSAWYRLCRRPVLAHCGSKYETSKVFGDMPPPQSIVKGSDNNWYKCILDHVSTSATAPVTGGSYTTYWSALGWTPTDTTFIPHALGRRYAVFSMNDTALDEARHRHLKWREAMLDTTLAFSNQNYDWAYENRNGGGTNAVTCYGFDMWGVTLGGNGTSGRCGCNSGRYGHVERFMNHWMVTGNPLFNDWMRRHANHLIGPCIIHWDGGGGGAQGQWLQYSEADNPQGSLHGQSFGMGTTTSTMSADYRGWMYLLDPYTPFKTAATKLLDFYYGGLSGVSIAVGGTDLFVQTIRDYTWPMQAYLVFYLCYGNVSGSISTPVLTHAANIFRHCYVNNGDGLVKTASTLQSDGGLGGVPVRAGWNLDETFHAHTYQSYPQDSIKYLHQVGTAASAAGETTITTTDLSNAARFLKQAACLALTGRDGISPNDASTLAKRVALTWPILRGGETSGGNVRLLCGSYAWRWSDLKTGSASTVRSSDNGFAAVLSTAIDGITATVSGTSVTFSSTVPYSVGSLANGNDTSPPPYGFFFYVTADGPTAAIQISTHAGGSASATLRSSYVGTTGAGKAFTVCMNANVTPDIFLTSLDAWAYTARIYKDAGQTAKYQALLDTIRLYYKHVMFYAPVVTGSHVDWASTFAETIREPVQIGTTGSLERESSYYTRRSGHFYLAWELAGNPASSGPSSSGSRYLPIRWP